MAETRVLAPLLELVERAEGKAILVGDPTNFHRSGRAGCSPPSASDSARSTSPTTAASATSRAQALALLRDGVPEAYLAHAARSGRLHLDDDRPTPSCGCSTTGGRPPQHDLAGT